MTGHSAGHGMDGIRNLDAARLQQIRQLADAVLRLRHCQTVARHDDHLLGVGELDRRIVDGDLPYGAARPAVAVRPWRRRLPKPPTRMLSIDRFMALAISLVRIAPDAPTSAPATMSTTSLTTKPAMETAVPVKELRSEMTTGMSAPPIGQDHQDAEQQRHR